VPFAGYWQSSSRWSRRSARHRGRWRADTGERFRVFHRDRWVSYLEQDGLAIAEGDILLGDARAPSPASADNPVPLKALVLDQANLLWPAVAGVHRVPYVYEAGPQANHRIRDRAVQTPRSPESSSGCRARTRATMSRSISSGPTGSCFSQVGPTTGGRQRRSGRAAGAGGVFARGPLQVTVAAALACTKMGTMRSAFYLFLSFLVGFLAQHSPNAIAA
jgi:hypothetical protein